MPDWAIYLLLIPAGFVAGIVNTIAGGGSFLTLPVLMFMYGLSPQMANGTNRVAILLSSASATATFHRAGQVDKSLVKRLGLPTFVGAPIGALLAVWLPPEAFKPLFGIIFLVMTVVLIFNPKRLTEKQNTKPPPPIVMTILFFGIGVYVGFIQAGMGMLLLLGMSLIRSGDLVAANGVKNVIGFLVTLAATIVFAAYNQIDWLPGLIMAGGNAAGGVVGAKLALKKGNRLVFAFLVVVMTGTGIKLLFWP